MQTDVRRQRFSTVIDRLTPVDQSQTSPLSIWRHGQLRPHQRSHRMNTDIISGKWTQLKGKARQSGATSPTTISRLPKAMPNICKASCRSGMAGIAIAPRPKCARSKSRCATRPDNAPSCCRERRADCRRRAAQCGPFCVYASQAGLRPGGGGDGGRAEPLNLRADSLALRR